jgi:phage/conjugal plasmid C-4 type zinc finger TraR family protein
MANEVIEITTPRKNDRTRLLLTAELNSIAARLHSEAEVPQAGVVGGDFLDVAQGIEHQEQARLSTSRLTERARRLRIALTRMSEGEYGLCSECGAAIPSRRLLAVPDATTCVACQSRLERVGASARGVQDDVELGRQRSA